MIVRVNGYPNFGVNQNCYYGLAHEELHTSVKNLKNPDDKP